jgi:hypothetical protein
MATSVPEKNHVFSRCYGSGRRIDHLVDLVTNHLLRAATGRAESADVSVPGKRRLARIAWGFARRA